jgi:hypothetical protein
MQHFIGKALDLDSTVVPTEGAVKVNYSRPIKNQQYNLLDHIRSQIKRR